MRICIVAATMEEVRPFVERHKLEESYAKRLKNHQVEFLITGVGIAAMTYYLTHHVLFRRSDFYILAGICGAFHRDIEIGDVVEVSTDTFADLGAENDLGNFLTLEDLGLNTEPCLRWKSTNAYHTSIPKVSGATVHQVPGRQERIDQIDALYEPVILSMEGAAFHYVMGKKNIPALHVRSISHYVGSQKKVDWNLPLAIHNLNAFLQTLIIDQPITKAES